MTENFCTYGSKREELLVGYVYDELGTAERLAFDRHLGACAPCRAELGALGDVRSELARWTPPDLTGHVAIQAAAPAGQSPGFARTIRQIPAWAQFAAATLIFGAAAGMANLDVSYGSAGLAVRTGWRHPAPVETAPAAAVPATVSATAQPAAPWQSDLAALEQSLRAAIETRPVAQMSSAPATNDDAVVRRVRQLLQDSERRQQSELALRVAEVARDMQSQRQNDLVKIDRTLGLIQSRTGMEVMRTQRQVNSLAQQVSQRP